MSKAELPDRPSLEYLKRRAKERLLELRQQDARAQLATAQLAVARDYGFSSWRALKAEIDRRRAPTITSFFDACDTGDVEALRELLAPEPGLVRERDANGGTCLHHAVRHPAALRLLLQHGADPNARDSGDNATPLFAAAAGPAESVRVLLDGGADVHGTGDVHQLEIIGAATCYSPTVPWDVVNLLLERGARHHIFSAIAVQDAEVIEKLVEENPNALKRRMSPFENRQTALHYVIAPPDGLTGGEFRTGGHYAILELLIELGADLEAEDDKGRTPLAVAMLRGDEGAMRRLRDAGAQLPKRSEPRSDDPQVSSLAASVSRVDAMLGVANVRESIEWFRTIGFEVESTHEDGGVIDWAGVYFGGAYLMLVPSPTLSHRRDVSFWFRTNRVDDLYQLLKRRQLDRASAVLSGKTPDYPEVRFRQDIYNAFYGEREFTIAEPNGYELTFAQSLPITR